MLIVLDNAADAAQVVPLLPGSPTCTVLITSRDRLTGLVTAHGARLVRLDVFGEPDARALLAERLGAESLARQAVAVRELVAGCAGLPLGVEHRGRSGPDVSGVPACHAGRRSCATPPPARRVGRGPDNGVRAVLSWSHLALAPAPAKVFALLGLSRRARTSACRPWPP